MPLLGPLYWPFQHTGNICIESDFLVNHLSGTRVNVWQTLSSRIRELRLCVTRRSVRANKLITEAYVYGVRVSREDHLSDGWDVLRVSVDRMVIFRHLTQDLAGQQREARSYRGVAGGDLLRIGPGRASLARSWGPLNLRDEWHRTLYHPQQPNRRIFHCRVARRRADGHVLTSCLPLPMLNFHVSFSKFKT